VYLAAAEAVIQGLKVKVVKGWGEAHSPEIDGNYVVPRDMLSNGGVFKLEPWRGRWELLRPP